LLADVSLGNGHLNIREDQVIIGHFFKKMGDGKLIVSPLPSGVEFPGGHSFHRL
jgi:hypothetical protein